MLAARPLLLFAAAMHVLLPAPAAGGAALTGAALLERASKLVPAAQLAPDALLWSPALPRARFYEEHWERRWALLKGADRAAARVGHPCDLAAVGGEGGRELGRHQRDGQREDERRDEREEQDVGRRRRADERLVAVDAAGDPEEGHEEQRELNTAMLGIKPAN